MNADEFDKIERDIANALERSKHTHWLNSFGEGIIPSVVKQRPSRPRSFSILEHGHLITQPEGLTFEQRLTGEDRAFLADLKVGL